LKGQKRADRNEQILSLLAQGCSNKAIAHKLEIDVKTVRRVRKGAKKRKPRASKLDVFKPVIQELVVKRQGRLELIDGFKRHRAAEQMGWTTLRVTSLDVDEQGQWAAMLVLNRATHSMSVLEEALVLREMVAMGMIQTQIGQILSRHKSWVSRRIGLIERLHPELVEQIREGILPPGAARRLLSLPVGNQLELATVVTHHGLGTQETELLVRLWRDADPPVRDYLLAHPQEALANARAGDPEEPPDPRLTLRGQRLQRHLRILQGMAPRSLQMLRPSPAEEDLRILAGDLESTRSSLSRLVEALSSARPSES
jgi:ParB-like chromosome segregation protein Spo0J